MLKVSNRTLLLIAGIVWFIAGFNLARLGILSLWCHIAAVVLVFTQCGDLWTVRCYVHDDEPEAHSAHPVLCGEASFLAFLRSESLSHHGSHDGRRDRTEGCRYFSRLVRGLLLHWSGLCSGPGRGHFPAELDLLQQTSGEAMRMYKKRVPFGTRFRMGQQLSSFFHASIIISSVTL